MVFANVEGVAEVDLLSAEGKLGPDRLISGGELTATTPDGCVKIRDLEDDCSVAPISVPSMLKHAAERDPEKVALGVKRDGEWIEWNYQKYYQESRTVAKAFIKLGN